MLVAPLLWPGSYWCPGRASFERLGLDRLSCLTPHPARRELCCIFSSFEARRKRNFSEILLIFKPVLPRCIPMFNCFIRLSISKVATNWFLPSMLNQYTFLLFFFTWQYLHSSTFSHVIKPWVLRYSCSSHALCGFTGLLLHFHVTLMVQTVTTR